MLQLDDFPQVFHIVSLNTIKTLHYNQISAKVVSCPCTQISVDYKLSNSQVIIPTAGKLRIQNIYFELLRANIILISSLRAFTIIEIKDLSKIFTQNALRALLNSQI